MGAITGDTPRLLTGMALTSPIRTNTPLGGHPLIMPARIPLPTSTGLINGSTGAGMPPPLIAAGDASAGLLYTPYAAADYANYAALTSPLLQEYTPDHAGGLFAR